MSKSIVVELAGLLRQPNDGDYTTASNLAHATVIDAAYRKGRKAVFDRPKRPHALIRSYAILPAQFDLNGRRLQLLEYSLDERKDWKQIEALVFYDEGFDFIRVNWQETRRGRLKVHPTSDVKRYAWPAVRGFGAAELPSNRGQYGPDRYVITVDLISGDSDVVVDFGGGEPRYFRSPESALAGAVKRCSELLAEAQAPR